jgi:hypothetical protein
MSICPDFGGLLAKSQVRRGAGSRCFHYAQAFSHDFVGFDGIS